MDTVHSGKLSASRPGIIVRVPPPFWALALAGVSWLISRWLHLPPVLRSDPLAFLLFVTGFCIALWGERTFVHAGTEVMPASATNRRVVVHGPFRYTRNPMYTGLLLSLLAVALFFGSWPFYVSVILLFLLVNGVFIPFEEAKMERQHGDEFRAYKSRTRRWGLV